MCSPRNLSRSDLRVLEVRAVHRWVACWTGEHGGPLQHQRGIERLSGPDVFSDPRLEPLQFNFGHRWMLELCERLLQGLLCVLGVREHTGWTPVSWDLQLEPTEWHCYHRILGWHCLV